MPLRSVGGGAWESAGGYFVALTTVIQAGDAFKLVSRETDGGAQVAHILDTENAFSTAGAKLLSVRNNGAEKAYVDRDGVGHFGSYVHSNIFRSRSNWDTRIEYSSGNWLLRTYRNKFIYFGHENTNLSSMYADQTNLLHDWSVGGSSGNYKGRLQIAARTLAAAKCGVLVLQAEDGTDFFLFVDTTGDLRIHTADPGADDTLGVVVGTQS